MIFSLHKSCQEQNHLKSFQLYQEQMKFSKGSNAYARSKGEKGNQLYFDLHFCLALAPNPQSQNHNPPITFNHEGVSQKSQRVKVSQHDPFTHPPYFRWTAWKRIWGSPPSSIRTSSILLILLAKFQHQGEKKYLNHPVGLTLYPPGIVLNIIIIIQ